MKIATFIIFISLFSSNLYSLDTYCDICNEKIISEYYIDAWGNKFHATHKENGVFCNTCSRIISKRLTGGGFQFNDGRHMCKLCSTSMINSNNLKIKSINNVIDMLKVIDIPVDENFLSINLIDRINLQNVSFSLSDHNEKTIKGYTYYNNKEYVINILWGLNQIEFEAVLAHELLHVWIDYNNIKLNRSKLEGFCNLGSSLVYDNYDLKLARILKTTIEDNPDPIYGKGYKYMNSLLQIHGWDKLISMLLDNN